MTTENTPVVDPNAEAKAKQDADVDALLSDMRKRAAEEAIRSAEQDAALAAVKAACDAEREALKQGI